MIPNRAESIRKMIRNLGPAEKLRASYEAARLLFAGRKRPTTVKIPACRALSPAPW
jgi:hypothetical protein